MQTKKNSFIEAVVNTFTGFLINLAFTPLFYWVCGINTNVAQISAVTLLFTLLSVARSYIIRRFFNKKQIIEIKVKEGSEVNINDLIVKFKN